jgi:DNA transposition AAA+ family ATPase
MLSEIWSWRHNLHQFLIEEVNRDERNQLNTLLQQGKDEEAMLVRHGHPTREKCEAIRKNVERLMYEAGWEYVAKRKRIEDPSELFIIDEADLLTDGALKEAITYFRRSRIGIVFLGTPKLCERLYRLPSVALSISAVHEFEPLSDTQVRQLFLDGWWTPRVSSRRHPAMDHESFMTIMEMTGGNFRRLYRLAQQIDHLIEVRRTRRITRKIVQAARKNLVFAAGVGS